MCADIYRTQNANTFLLVPRGSALDGVPQSVLQALGHPVFMSSRDLSDPLLSVDTTQISLDITNQGFSVRMN